MIELCDHVLYMQMKIKEIPAKERRVYVIERVLDEIIVVKGVLSSSNHHHQTNAKWTCQRCLNVTEFDQRM